jgi:hypothetical protein
LICNWSFHESLAKGRSWPVPVLGAEWRISTQLGHSRPLTRTSAIESESGRSITAVNQAADIQAEMAVNQAADIQAEMV